MMALYGEKETSSRHSEGTPFRARRPLSRLEREHRAEAEHVLYSVGGRCILLTRNVKTNAKSTQVLCVLPVSQEN